MPKDSGGGLQKSQKAKWKAAIYKELQALADLNVFRLVKRTPDMHVLKNRWVFAEKTEDGNKVIEERARLVVKGCFQQYGIDYQETFSPTVKLQSVKILLTLAAYYDLELIQFDVGTAFLNAELNEQIYIEVPEGMEVPNDGEEYVLQLLKALYGLKQANRAWNKTVTADFKSQKFEVSPFDPCVFTKRNGDKLWYLYMLMMAWWPQMIQMNGSDSFKYYNQNPN